MDVCSSVIECAYFTALIPPEPVTTHVALCDRAAYTVLATISLVAVTPAAFDHVHTGRCLLWALVMFQLVWIDGSGEGDDRFALFIS